MAIDIFSKIKSIVLITLIFIFPLFLLPITQEFYLTNKLFLLLLGALLLILISAIELIMTKKIKWETRNFDKFVFFLVISIALSIIISSPNKIQALTNVNYGLAGIFSLGILYYYLSRNNKHQQWIHRALIIPSVIISTITIVNFFQLFKNLNLPTNLKFLTNANFTPLGTHLDLAIFLGFIIIYQIVQLITAKTQNGSVTKKFVPYILLVANLSALSLSLYSILKPASDNQSLITTLLPPFNISWYAAVETLKSPVSALFGTGIDNFTAMYTKVKDVAYNQSSLWQINSFAIGRSSLLHVFTESGILGGVSFILLLFSLVKTAFKSNPIIELKANGTGIKKSLSPLILNAVYLLLVVLFLPPSLPVFFLLFLFLAIVSRHSNTESEPSLINLSNLIPLYIGIPLITLVVIGIASYFLGRSYLAEYYFKKSLDGYIKNNLKILYDNQRQAIILNPYIERYRVNFSQTNLLLANSVATKASSSAKAAADKQSETANQLSEQDRQTITQTIQTAIAEAKAAVSLNPQKAGYWENLAVIYKNILSVAQGADAWAISAYQRAIVLDPQNPIYRLNLGGILYSSDKFDEAEKLFEQAAGLKPDWPNAHYNLAWTSYQKANYARAVTEMQTTLSLLNASKDKEDYKKAQAELEEFKKKLPVEDKEAAKPEETKPNQLTLPTPKPTISPKITLPKEASPEAK